MVSIRPGMRIIGEQFAPYDEGPFQEEVDEADDRALSSFNFKQMTAYTRRMAGSFQRVSDAMKESMRVIEEAERKEREKIKKLEDAAAKALSNHASGTVIDFNAFKKPIPSKLGSDHEPYYVKLTRPKKRR